MNEILTILKNSGYSVTKNIYIGTNCSYVISLSVYCVGLLLDSELVRLGKLLKMYDVFLTKMPNEENINVRFK